MKLEGTLNLGGQDDVSVLHTASGESKENMFLAEYVIEAKMGKRWVVNTHGYLCVPDLYDTYEHPANSQRRSRRYHRRRRH